MKGGVLVYSCSLTCMLSPGLVATPGSNDGPALTAAPATARISLYSSQGSTRVTLSKCTLVCWMARQAGRGQGFKLLIGTEDLKLLVRIEGSPPTYRRGKTLGQMGFKLLIRI